MSKKLSLTSLFAITFFLMFTCITSNVQNDSSNFENLGYPFVFFSAFKGTEVINNQNFSIFALIGDLVICFIVASILVNITSLFKTTRKKKIVA